jgi:hypothetical protein
MGCKLLSAVSAAFAATLLAAVVFSTPVAAQECSPVDIELGSQAEVDSFQADHGPCDRATNLTVQGADIVNLDGLAGLATVHDKFSISNNRQLKNIDGFPALTHVGELVIYYNDSLAAIDGLNALTSTDSQVYIRFNYELKSIHGLTSLRSVGEDLRIQNSFNLDDLDGLSGVTSIKGDLTIANTILDNLDSLSNLTSVGGDVFIVINHLLRDCNGLMRLLDGNDDEEPGPGTGVAGVPDVGGEVVLRENWVGCNSIRQILLGINRFKINPGLNDAWFDPETAGQGFLITVLPETRTLFLAWFTFDTNRPEEGTTAYLGDAGHRWLTAQGSYYGEDFGERVALDVYLTQGGVFDSVEPAPETSEPIGQIIINWDDCENARLYYDLDRPKVRGEMFIRRIVQDNVALCEALSSID